MANPVFDPLGVELVNVERAWHSMAKNDPNSKWDIVDIDAMPFFDNPHAFNTGDEVADALEELSEKAEHDSETPNIDFIREKIRAHLLYLRVSSGEQVSFDEQTRTTMGVSLEMIDEDILDRHRQALDAQLMDAKTIRPLRYARGHQSDIKDELVIHNEDTVRSELIAGRDWATKFILTRTGLMPPAIYPDIVSVDEGWTGYLGTDDDRNFVYQVNTHPRHEYTLGMAWANAPHELAHITEATSFREAIMRGEISVALGVTSLHSPEVTRAEFNAQAMEQMALRELGSSNSSGTGSEVTWRYRFEADYQFYSEMVWNNAHVMINSGVDTNEVVKYVEKRLLLATHENVAKIVPDRRDDPMIRGYFAAYWPGLVVAMDMIKPGHLLDPLGEEPDPKSLLLIQREVLGSTMSGPIRLDEARQKIAGLVSVN